MLARAESVVLSHLCPLLPAARNIRINKINKLNYQHLKHIQPSTSDALAYILYRCDNDNTCERSLTSLFKPAISGFLVAFVLLVQIRSQIVKDASDFSKVCNLCSNFSSILSTKTDLFQASTSF